MSIRLWQKMNDLETKFDLLNARYQALVDIDKGAAQFSQIQEILDQTGEGMRKLQAQIDVLAAELAKPKKTTRKSQPKEA